VPPEILAEERAASSKLSDMIFDTMEAETQSPVRKVGLNPDVYTGYNYLKARGDLHGEDDTGDFINYCITVVMTKLCGARVGARDYLSVDILQ
jgi:hypothetical protein